MFTKSKSGKTFIYASATVIILMIIAAALAPGLSPYSPDLLDLKGSLDGPSWVHPLGQDRLGRDILACILYGSRVSLSIGFLVVTTSLIVGTSVGIFAGYAGGWVDEAAMRMVDVLLSFPGILLAITLAGMLGPSFKNIVLALTLLGWVGFARLTRGEVLSLKEREFVGASKALGAGPFWIATKHLLPNLAAPLAVQATFSMASTILAESSLSFLGLGPQDAPTWGSLLSQGVDYLLFSPHIAIFPGLAIMCSVLGINLLGEAIQDKMDPKRIR